MNVNIVIVGHVDHGKSTLIGRLLYDSAALPEDKLAETQKLLEEYKRRFEFAYFLDSFEDELKEERTIDTTRILFKGKNYYTIVDVPGHREFIKNMLTGASHAQVAILVVSAPEGVEEQTRRHSFLLKMLGIKKLLVAINKMDLVDYQRETFEKAVHEAQELLSSLGLESLAFIPVSALEGENVYKTSATMEWYKGPNLMQALDEIQPEKISEKSLRFVVQDVCSVDLEEVVVGRVETGTLRKGEEILFQPSGQKGKVEKIKFFPRELEEATFGDSIGIVTRCQPKRGDVGGRLGSPPSSRAKFLGEFVLLEGALKKGEEFGIKCGTKRARCVVMEMRKKINPGTGEVLEENVEEMRENEAMTAVFETEPMVMEKFSNIPQLGRFVLTSQGKNIGAGVILEA